MRERVKNNVLSLFWIILTGGISILTAYNSVDTIGDMIHTNKKSNELDVRIAKYEAKLASDSTFIENMKNKEFLERYAREHFHMQREGEMVYIVK